VVAFERTIEHVSEREARVAASAAPREAPDVRQRDGVEVPTTSLEGAGARVTVPVRVKRRWSARSVHA
jgi:hypothetical protein